MKTTRRIHIPAARLLRAAFITVSPAIAAADAHGQGVSQNRNGPFNEFDLKVIGVALVAVMIILGIRALKRRRS